MPKKKPTIYDVAKSAGVSISTISRVLNAPDKVNANTRKTVMTAIDTLGFTPKAEARARALQNTGRIGVLAPFFTAPSFVQRLRGVAAALSRANYELVIYPVDSIDHLHGYLSSIPLMGNLDGLIIMSLAIADKDANRLYEKGMETVLIEYSHPQLNGIIINDLEGGRIAAELLVKKGHKHIAFMGDIEPPEKYAIHPVKSRLQGFKQVLDDAGIALPAKYIGSCKYEQEPTMITARELLMANQRPSAMFVASDIQALGVMKVARQMGLRIPDDLAIIGFDDIDVADHVDLTTIRQHLDESGRLGVEILLSHIQDVNRPLQNINLPLELIERQTT